MQHSFVCLPVHQGHVYTIVLCPRLCQDRLELLSRAKLALALSLSFPAVSVSVCFNWALRVGPLTGCFMNEIPSRPAAQPHVIWRYSPVPSPINFSRVCIDWSLTDGSFSSCSATRHALLCSAGCCLRAADALCCSWPLLARLLARAQHTA